MKTKLARRQQTNLMLVRAKLPQVEVELLALEDVAIGTAALARARRDARVQATSEVLLLQMGVDLGLVLAAVNLALGVVAALLVERIVLGDRLALLAAQRDTVVSLVPLHIWAKGRKISTWKYSRSAIEKEDTDKYPKLAHG